MPMGSPRYAAQDLGKRLMRDIERTCRITVRADEIGVRSWQILLQKSKIERLRKSRES